MHEVPKVGEGSDTAPPPAGAPKPDAKEAMDRLKALLGGARAAVPKTMSEPEAILEVLKLLDRELERMHETYRQTTNNPDRMLLKELHEVFGGVADHLDTLFREERMARRAAKP